MAKISMNKAAKLAGKSRNTLKSHIEKGKLSAEKDENGHWEIDVAELERVYGSLRSPTKQSNAQESKVEHSSNTLTDQRIPLLEQEVQFKDQQIASLKRQLDEAKVDKAEWMEQAKSAQRLLTTGKAHEDDTIITPPPSSQSKKRGSWWPFGGRDA